MPLALCSCWPCLGSPPAWPRAALGSFDTATAGLGAAHLTPCAIINTDAGEAWMSRTLSLGALLFAFVSLDVCWAQNKADEPAFPFTKSIFRWEYSCPAGLGCSFACPGEAGAVGHLVKLRLHLGAISIDGSQTAPALFYEYSTREIPHASGFSIGSGLSNLSCHVNGMTLDYAGPSK
jgi:hypothetical protein